MDAEKIANILFSTRIGSLEDIAAGINEEDIETYIKGYAFEIVRQKLDNSGLRYKEHDDYPFIVANTFIEIVPQTILKKNNLKKLKSYGGRLSKEIGSLVMCLPYPMNAGKYRTAFARKLDVGFVDLHYDKKILDKLFKKYVIDA